MRLRAAIAEAQGDDQNDGSFLDGYWKKRFIDLLYKIPNVPHEKVPAGVGADDNLKVSENGSIPTRQRCAAALGVDKKIRHHRL